ncbi:unnamed protein product [Mytilus coruscus]|uniref:PiggyBac transposable element-derived protein domain-containing protein n=1 Tax=Mytilus coruscus TaxID=42192 RepID=A0A6J8BDH3_MYTCO|nr:unnamed protein product [Mytilus coruscus]
MKSWRALTEIELKSFLAIVFNMGLIRKSSIEEYWNSSLPRTLRENRPMSNTIRNANPTPDNPVYMRNDKMLCAAFRDVDGKKPVRMLSTAFSAQHLPSGRPRIANGYNKNIGAVDTTDAIMKAIVCWEGLQADDNIIHPNIKTVAQYSILVNFIL